MKEIKIEKWKSVGKLFLGFVWKSFVVISIIITVLSAFTNFDSIKAHPFITASILITTTVFTTLFYVIYKLVVDEIMNMSTLDLPKEIERFVQHLYKKKKYIDVVRFGSPISRFLWLSGNNKQRITIGIMVEDSASKIGRIQEQISALIDDIGWTHSAIGEHEIARQNIVNGIEKAKLKNLFYFAAKGERHLAGIESSLGNKDKIIDHLNKAQEFTQKITDKSEKDEMEASLFLAKSEYYFENRQYGTAETNAKSAKDVFVNDLDRIVKVYSLLGNIYLAQQNYQWAKDEFNHGYNMCKDIRKDEFAKNGVGLAKVEIHATNLKVAEAYLNEAKEIFEDCNKNKELTEVNNLLRQITNAT